MNGKLKGTLKRILFWVIASFAFLGFSVAAISGWAFWQYASTRSKELKGEKAVAEVQRWFEGRKPPLSDVRAYYSRTGIPADPAFFYKFVAPKEVIDRLVNQYSMKQQELKPESISRWIEKFQRFHGDRDAWWHPEMTPVSSYYAGDQEGNSSHLFYDEATRTCHLHIQNS